MCQTVEDMIAELRTVQLSAEYIFVHASLPYSYHIESLSYKEKTLFIQLGNTMKLSFEQFRDILFMHRGSLIKMKEPSNDCRVLGLICGAEYNTKNNKVSIIFD